MLLRLHIRRYSQFPTISAHSELNRKRVWLIHWIFFKVLFLQNISNWSSGTQSEQSASSENMRVY